MTQLPSLLLLFISVAVFASCDKKEDYPPGIADTYANTVVLQWNEAAVIAVTRTGGLPPMTESRIHAMVNVAIHDALNNIVKKFDTYALTGTVDGAANPDAAVAQAAHDIIIALLPPQQPFADSVLTVSLAAITNGNAKDKGITVGKSSAMAMLTKRMGDGASTAQYPIVQGTMPGIYRSTPPFDATGFAILPGWDKVKPFSLLNAKQFRPVPPYPINSAAYTADYNEVKTMGCATCPARNADQTQTGIFWLENVPLSWNRITRTLIAQYNVNGWQSARLLALVHIAEADANIACFDGKMFYNYWRPLTAIRSGESDGNADTHGDAAWINLAPPTPPAPDYPSNHAADGGAAAEVLKHFLGEDEITFSTTSTTMNGITRHFTSLSEAATEVSLSRIYVGFHFRNAVVVGEGMGRKIGKYVFENSLRPK